MGFMSRVSCAACGFEQEYVPFGLTAGCMSVIALAQDQMTGALRSIEVFLDEIREQNGQPIGSDDEFVEALSAVVTERLRATERSITPHQAVCPGCRGNLVVQEYGIM